MLVNGKEVPNNYDELIAHFPYALPTRYKDMGRERFEGGLADKYMRDWEGGKINQAFIPGNDTLLELEEEVIDAVFNTAVYFWKTGGVGLGRSIPVCLLNVMAEMNRMRIGKELRRMRDE